MGTQSDSSLQELIARIEKGEVTEDQLLSFVGDPRLLLRANALAALSRRAPENESRVVEVVRAAAFDCKAGQRILGALTQQMLAAMVLNKLASDRAMDAFKQVTSTWDATQLSDLKWHLSNTPLSL